MARETRTSIKTWQRRERALVAKQTRQTPPHDCNENVEYVETDGALGQAYYCRVCGKLVQVG